MADPSDEIRFLGAARFCLMACFIKARFNLLPRCHIAQDDAVFSETFIADAPNCNEERDSAAVTFKPNHFTAIIENSRDASLL